MAPSRMQQAPCFLPERDVLTEGLSVKAVLYGSPFLPGSKYYTAFVKVCHFDLRRYNLQFFASIETGLLFLQGAGQAQSSPDRVLT